LSAEIKEEYQKFPKVQLLINLACEKNNRPVSNGRA